MSTDQPTTRSSGPGPRSTRLVLAAVLLATCLGALDQTVMAAAMPTIGGQLHDYDALAWVITAYAIGAGISTPLYGKLADLYGRRALYTFALVSFLAGSALAGAAQTMSELIAFRALQGLGAGGMMVLTLVVIADIVPLGRRGKVMGLYGVVLGLASMAGPVVGGLLTDRLSWRWVFFINLPLGAIALAVVLRFLRLPSRTGSHRVDYLGFVLLSGAVVCSTLVGSWGGVRYPWRSAVVVALAAGTAIFLALFILAERVAAEPLVPLHLFRNRTIVLAGLVNMLLFTVVNGCAMFMPMFLQLVTGRTATDTGLLTIPMVAGLMFSTVIGGALITRYARYTWAPISGCALGAVAVFGLSTLNRDAGVLLVVSYFVLFGIALGLVMQPLTLGVQAEAPDTDLGAATATVAFSQRIGGAIGLAALGAVFASRYAAELAQGRGLQSALMNSINTVFLCSAAVMALAFLLTLLLRNIVLTETEVRNELDTLDSVISEGRS